MFTDEKKFTLDGSGGLEFHWNDLRNETDLLNYMEQGGSKLWYVTL